jgi:hypothetical protein
LPKRLVIVGNGMAPGRYRAPAWIDGFLSGQMFAPDRIDDYLTAQRALANGPTTPAQFYCSAQKMCASRRQADAWLIRNRYRRESPISPSP